MTLLGAGDFLSWTRTLRREELPQPPAKPGRKVQSRPPVGLDPVVFGDWPGTYPWYRGDQC